MSGVALMDPAARLFMLSHLVSVMEQFDPSRTDEFMAAGLTPDLVDRLRTLSTSDLWRLVAMNHHELRIQIDTNRLRYNLERMDATKNEQSLLEYFVRSGASPNMMSRLFGMHIKQIRSYQVMLNVKNSMGRPPMPDVESRLSIVQHWTIVCADVPESTSSFERERFFRLHRHFPQFSMSTLDAVIASYLSESGGDQAKRSKS
jgi:Protein of unknown function (DUF2857)